MGVARYTVWRVLYSIPVLLGVSLVSFSIIHITPGSPAQHMAGQVGSQRLVEQLQQQLYLNEPIHIQYIRWISDVVGGNLGTSWTVRPETEVTTLLLQRLPVTLELAILSVIFAICIGLPAGILSAIHQNRYIDHITRVVALTGISMPNFWLGIVLIMLFAVHFQFQWGSGGWVSPLKSPVENFQLLLLPALTNGTAISALYARMMRSEMLDTMNADFVTNARLMGLNERDVILRDAAKNALIPVVTIIGLSFAMLLGGTIVVETVFDLPGIGSLFLAAISQRDYPLIQAVVLFISAIFIVMNTIVDIVYAYIDPRISYDR